MVPLRNGHLEPKEPKLFYLFSQLALFEDKKGHFWKLKNN
jgi:hypothetical protein